MKPARTKCWSSSSMAGCPGIAKKPRPPRSRWHLATFAASALRRDCAVAHCQRAGSAAHCAQWRRNRWLYPPAGLARFRLSPAASLPGHHQPEPQSALRRIRLGEGRSGCTAGLAARPHRHPDRRCRYASALAHRLDAQPRAHDRRQFFCASICASTGSKARAGSGTRWWMRTWPTTRWAGSGWPAPAPMRRPISACSIQ